MKKGHITKNTGIKSRDIRRKASNSHVRPDHSKKHSGNHWEWDDDEFISELGF